MGIERINISVFMGFLLSPLCGTESISREIEKNKRLERADSTECA